MTITKIRRHTVKVLSGVPRGHCPVCQREVEMLTPDRAGELLQPGNEALQALLGAGEIQAIETTVGEVGGCEEPSTGSAEAGLERCGVHGKKREG